MNDDDEGHAPTLDGERSQTEQRELAAQLIHEHLDGGLLNTRAESLDDAAAHVHSELVAEVARGFVAGGAEQLEQGLLGHDHAEPLTLKRHLSAPKVEFERLRGVELWLCHKSSRTQGWVELCQYTVALARTVKSLRFGRVFWGLGLAIGLFFRTQPADAYSILLGPAPRRVKSTPILDPSLPTGAERARQLDIDESGHPRLCSPTRPLCVTWSDEASPVLDALSQLEVAYDRLVLALGLPEPRRSDEALPLTWRLGPSGEPLTIRLKPNLTAGFDTASIVCHSGTEKDLARIAHLCVGEAIAARLDPAETPEARRAYALDLWWTVGGLTNEDIAGLVQVQSNPQAAPFTRDSLSEAPAAALMFDYLDRKYGNASPAALPTGILALSAQRTPHDAWRYSNQPDTSDVFRATFDDDLPVWAHRILDFAVARQQAVAGPHAVPPLSTLGELAGPRIDWVIKASTLPRRVAPALPLQPWGSIYVQVELDVELDKLELGIKAEWEDPVAMVWQILKLDDSGVETGRVDVAFEQRGHEFERRLVALEGTRSLLIVGTNLGGVDLAHPFDPDHEPFEPHGCTVYVGRL